MPDRDLSEKILSELEDASKTFSRFQEQTKLLCPTDCGKCCENPDVTCAPYELLPMAYHLIDLGIHEEVLQNAKDNINKACIFLNTNRCSQYGHRPYICRSFAVTGRHHKNGTEFSICKVLKDKFQISTLSATTFEPEEIPYIEILRKKFESIDPNLLAPQVNINQALVIILEKVLLKKLFTRTT